MKAVWSISGKFYGWITENGAFYKPNGKRRGTFQDPIIYDHEGKYLGELVNECFIGINQDRNFLKGPECYLEEEIIAYPREDIEPFIGYATQTRINTTFKCQQLK